MSLWHVHCKLQFLTSVHLTVYSGDNKCCQLWSLNIVPCAGLHCYKNVSVMSWCCVPCCAVIGKGGEQIASIQSESECKIQFAPGTICLLALSLSVFY